MCSRPQVGQLFRDSVIIVLSTPCTMGTIVALILNAIIPAEEPDPEEGKIRADPLVPLGVCTMYHVISYMNIKRERLLD